MYENIVLTSDDKMTVDKFRSELQRTPFLWGAVKSRGFDPLRIKFISSAESIEQVSDFELLILCKQPSVIHGLTYAVLGGVIVAIFLLYMITVNYLICFVGIPVLWTIGFFISRWQMQRWRKTFFDKYGVSTK
jgi:hypothetical protein